MGQPLNHVILLSNRGLWGEMCLPHSSVYALVCTDIGSIVLKLWFSLFFPVLRFEYELEQWLFILYNHLFVYVWVESKCAHAVTCMWMSCCLHELSGDSSAASHLTTRMLGLHLWAIACGFLWVPKPGSRITVAIRRAWQSTFTHRATCTVLEMSLNKELNLPVLSRLTYMQ